MTQNKVSGIALSINRRALKAVIEVFGARLTTFAF